jgi:predicted dehydrogenase
VPTVAPRTEVVPALVIGLGSIGVRHRSVLQAIGCAVSAVSRRSGVGDFLDVGDAVAAVNPSYVVIATENSARQQTLTALEEAGYSGRLLIEKPLGDIQGDLESFDQVHVGYNLRFHPVLQALRSELGDEAILSVQSRAGQYLPDWRPERDHRTTASAETQAGVLKDLSHELDWYSWLFGRCHSVTASSGRSPLLDINVDATVAGLARYDRAPILSFELNYCDRIPQRWVHVTTNTRSLRADLIAGALWVDNARVLSCSLDRDETYHSMHFEALGREQTTLCSLQEGRNVMLVIAAIEKATQTKTWVDL